MSHSNNNFLNFEPDESSYRAIMDANDIVLAKQYYALLSNWLKSQEQTGARHPKFGRAMSQYFSLETWIESSEGESWKVEGDSPTAQPTNFGGAGWRPKTIIEVQQEILTAATSSNPSIALTQVAAANGFPLSLVELWAERLLTDEGLRNKFRIVEDEYRSFIDAMREIELHIDDPGLKSWKVQDLARKYRRTEKQLRESFCKSLISQHLAEPITYKELTEKTSDKQKWLLKGFIPDPALILLIGAGGTGKTLLTHHFLKLILTGEHWGEYKARKTSVLYIQSDSPLQGVRHYFEQSNLPKDVSLFFHADWQIDQSAQLYAWCKKYKPGLIVIDSLTSVSRNSTVSENDTEYARPILYMGEIRRELGISFLILHHTNSEGKQRGNKAVTNAVDEVWNLMPSTKDPSDPNRILAIEKSRSRPLMKYKLKFDNEDYRWDNEGEAVEDPQPQNSTCRTSITNFLNANPDTWFAIEELAERINWSRDTVRRELAGLYKEGLVNRKPNPEYRQGTSQPKHYYSN